MSSIAVITPPPPIQLPPPPMDINSLIEKTVFLKVTFGRLGTSRRVGNEVLETDADMSLLKVTKTLLESPELEAIKSADTQLRKYLFNTCLPFEMSILILPEGLVQEVYERLEKHAVQREVMVDAFVAAYPKLCEEAVAHLGSLYDVSDYPSVLEIREKFIFKYKMFSFDVPGSLKGISQALFNAEKKKKEAEIQSALEDITLLMRQDLLDLVTHLETRLSPDSTGKRRQLRESSVSNLEEFLKSFDLRNVTNDVELAALVTEARVLINGTSTQALRSSDHWREQLRSGMEKIKATLSTMVESQPARKFILDDE